MKNILLIHGFNGIPEIFRFFNEKLKKDFNVITPEFPIQQNITIESYFEILNKYERIFNKDLIVIAHSLGNAMILKYINQKNLNIGLYISLAGFSESFKVEGKEVLNKVIQPLDLTENEISYAKKNIDKKYSIYSDNDHIVPIKILEQFSDNIESKPILIPNIGHMGKKIGLKELPEVVEIIIKEQ